MFQKKKIPKKTPKQNSIVRKRNNSIMVRLPTPKKKSLPNGRTFMTKYERGKKSNPSSNVTIRRRYKNELEDVDREAAIFKRLKEK